MPKIVEKKKLSVNGVDQHGNEWSLTLENPEVTNKFVLSLNLNGFEFIVERYQSERSAEPIKKLLAMLSKSPIQEEIIAPAKAKRAVNA